MTRILLSSVAAAAVLASAPAAWAQTEIQFWHAMGGNLGESVNALAEGFNKSQSEYKVVPVYKGSYTETLTAAIAAFRAKQAPHIVQVFEVGTATMMSAKGAVKPVYQLMKETGEKFDPNFQQAMFEVPDASVPSGTVVQVVQAGYMIGERILRPALVGVSKGGAKAAPTADITA